MKKGNRKLIILLALLFIIGGAVVLLPTPSSESVAPADDSAIVKVDDSLPEFTVEMTTGETIKTSDLRGKVTLINFWATWCPPCQEELARVEEDIIKRFEGSDLVFLPISRGESVGMVRDYLGYKGYSFASGVDADASIFHLFAKEGIPRNYLVNRQGVVVKASLGYSAEDFDELVKHIDMTLKAR